MKFDLRKCSNLRVLALAVAYAQISRSEYSKLRTRQLQAIEFGKEPPKISEELIEKTTNAFNQSAVDQVDADSDVTQVRESKNISDSIKNSVKNQLDINTVDISDWVSDSDSQRESLTVKAKKILSNIAKISMKLGIAAAIGLALYQGYLYYQNKNLATNDIPVKQMEKNIATFNSGDQTVERLQILLQSGKLLIENSEYKGTELLIGFNSMLNEIDQEERIDLYYSSLMLEIEFILSQRKEFIEELLSNALTQDENTIVNYKIQIEYIDKILETLLEIKLEIFNQ